jgi:hypothetical protein
MWVLVGLWYSMALSTIFQLYRGCQFNWWIKPHTCRKSFLNSCFCIHFQYKFLFLLVKKIFMAKCLVSLTSDKSNTTIVVFASKEAVVVSSTTRGKPKQWRGRCLESLIIDVGISGVMIFNGTFNNISVISWLSV